jgi:TetR/AcrR family transcriptional repressor of mexJK operon
MKLLQENDNRCTSEKILYAAIDLIADKGYKKVTTKEIAAVSQVSEMTLFRHFGSKRVILEKAIERFSATVCLDHIFANQLKWDLPPDLLLISRNYLSAMIRNDKVFLILVKEGTSLNELDHEMARHPEQLQLLLSHYFGQMHQKGKLISGDYDALANAFIRINFGTYATRLLYKRQEADLNAQQIDELLIIYTQIFARGVTP